MLGPFHQPSKVTAVHQAPADYPGGKLKSNFTPTFRTQANNNRDFTVG
jgi:hypothetical protein